MKTGSPRRLYPSHFFQPLLVGFRRRLKIPVNFMKNYLNEVLIKSRNATRTLSVLLKSHNREWVVKLDEDRRFLGKGWTKFIDEYFHHDDDDDLKKMDVGDILVFKHIGNLVFDVSVFHPSTCLPKHPNHHSNINKEHTLKKKNMKIPTIITTAQKKKEQFTSSKSKPFFDSVIKMNTNILKKAMYVPLAFVKENGLECSCEVILKDDRGRRWEVDAKFYPRRSHLYLTKGWYEFHIGNGLKLGDCLRFSLVKNNQRPIILVKKLPKKKIDVERKRS